MWQSDPTVVSASTETCGPRRVRAPIWTRGPMMQNGPTSTPGPSSAVGWMMALGCTSGMAPSATIRLPSPPLRSSTAMTCSLRHGVDRVTEVEGDLRLHHDLVVHAPDRFHAPEAPLEPDDFNLRHQAVPRHDRLAEPDLVEAREIGHLPPV